MKWVSIEVISKDRKKRYLPLRGIKAIQTQTFRNILNDLSPITPIAFPLGDNNTGLILVKTIKPDGIGCQIINTLNDLAPDLLIYFEIKNIRFVFPSVQICEEAPLHNDFDKMI